MALTPSLNWAAGRVVVNADRNLNIVVQDAFATASGTRLLYYTIPDISQPHVREKCAANYYVLDLKPGLTGADPQLLAENYCSHFGMTGRILSNGDVVIVAGDRVETWRAGQGKLGEWLFSGVESLGSYGAEINDGNVPLDVSRSGEVVIAKLRPRKRNDTEPLSGVVMSLGNEGSIRWQYELKTPEVLLGVVRAWTTRDGGALLYVTAQPMSGAQLANSSGPQGALVNYEERLYLLSSTGALSRTMVVGRNTMPDMSQPMEMPDFSADPGAIQAIIERQRTLMRMESVDQIAVRALDDDNVRILFRRGSSDPSRKGSYYYLIDADRESVEEQPIQAVLDAGALTNWIDFGSNDSELLVYGAAGTRLNRLPQGYLSRMDPASGEAATWLAPLSEMGLNEARNARDEQFRNLEHNPAQQPVLLTRLGGNPLMVSLIRQSRRPAIQLDEANAELELYKSAR